MPSGLKNKRKMAVLAWLVIAIWTAGCAQSAGINLRSTASADRIQIYFKLDPRLLGPTYGGERWVSPPTYGPLLSPGDRYVMEARAQGYDRNGDPLQVATSWVPENPELVTVAVAEDDLATITIHGPGESRLQVTSEGISKTLIIRAEMQGKNILVSVSQ